MQLKSTSATGNFELETNTGEKLLEFTYSNWFSSNARTSFQSTEIEIKPKNIWSSKFDIVKNGVDKGDISFNWKGNVIIRLENDDTSESQYLLRAIGYWKLGFELVDEKERKIALLKPNFNWSKFSYNYEIELADGFQADTRRIELLIYSGFGANCI
jgi:hypothetical protein